MDQKSDLFLPLFRFRSEGPRWDFFFGGRGGIPAPLREIRLRHLKTVLTPHGRREGASLSGFVSNFFFGQGPRTPWQMFCFGIVNIGSVTMFSAGFSWELLAAYASGLPFGLVHAASTVIFLSFLANPMIEKIERIQIKYGLLESAEG